MHKVLVNRLGGLSLPRKSVVRLTNRPDMTLDVYRGRKTTQHTTSLLLNIVNSFKGFFSPLRVDSCLEGFHCLEKTLKLPSLGNLGVPLYIKRIE